MADLNSFILPLIGGVAGGLVTHVLAAQRDRANKARENAVVHLISAFRTFSKANGRAKLYEIGDELQQAVADIHLFGRPKDIALVQKFVDEMLTTSTANLDPLLTALRVSYRDQVGLPAVEGKIHWLRVVDPNSEDARLMEERGQGTRS